MRFGASGSSSTRGSPVPRPRRGRAPTAAAAGRNSADAPELWPARRGGRAGGAFGSLPPTSTATCLEPVAAREVAVRRVEDEQGAAAMRRQEGRDAPVRGVELREVRGERGLETGQSAGAARHSASRTAAASAATSTGSSQVWGSNRSPGWASAWASSIGMSSMPREQSATGRPAAARRSCEQRRLEGDPDAHEEVGSQRAASWRASARRCGARRRGRAGHGPGPVTADPSHHLEHRWNADPDLERLAGGAARQRHGRQREREADAASRRIVVLRTAHTLHTMRVSWQSPQVSTAWVC